MMAASGSIVADEQTVVAAVTETGLLFLSDPKRRNAVQILTGEFPRGSWWSHPDAHRIYDVLQDVEGHPDLLSTKLLSGKVTFVHRRLWPALLAVVAVTPREPWQVTGLSPGASQWLAALDQAALSASEVAQPSRTIIKEVEARLLARGESVHISQGRHETRLEPWSTWAGRLACPWPPSLSSAEGKRALEAAAAAVGPPAPTFPWGDHLRR
jgi:hypothetical protein